MLALERVRAVGPRAADDRELLLEPLHAHAQRRELEAEGRVLGLVPAGPEAELDAAARDVVDRCHGLGQDGRVAEGGGRDQHAEPQGRRDRGQPRHRRPGLERAALVAPVDGEVVVGAEQRAHAVRLASLREGDPLRPGDVFLALDHQLGSHAASLVGRSGQVERGRDPRYDAVDRERRQAVRLEESASGSGRRGTPSRPSRRAPTSAGPRTPLPLSTEQVGQLEHRRGTDDRRGQEECEARGVLVRETRPRGRPPSSRRNARCRARARPPAPPIAIAPRHETRARSARRHLPPFRRSAPAAADAPRRRA